VFKEAEERFSRYWQDRARAQSQGIDWARWQEVDGRERAMLLTYFKPELADFPARRPVRIPVIQYGIYDGLSQSDDLRVTFVERGAASPEPDTQDLVAATAAIIRAAVERSVRRYQDRVSMLAIGLPSFGHGSDPGEAMRARQRRDEAVARSEVRRDFGTSDFQLTFFGEAQAAAFALDISSEHPEVYAIVVDVGAGTTDLALVPYRRDGRGRLLPGAPVLTETERFAGRDLNLAIGLGLKTNKDFERAIDLLDSFDPRAWQLVMDQEVERIKRELTEVEQSHQIRLVDIAGHVEGCELYDHHTRLLRKSPRWELSTRTPEIQNAVRGACSEWRDRVVGFLERSAREVGGDGSRIVAIELVGGAFRFAHLRHVLDSAVRNAGLKHIPVQYRDNGDAAQTAVARGLARWAAMQ